MSFSCRRKTAKTLIRISSVFALIILLKAAQQSPQQPPLKYEVSVTLKLVQVTVVDKGGKPVRDLTKDEFVLVDNGKPVTITEFERHDLAAAPAPAAVEAPAITERPAEESPAGPVTEPRTVHRKFIILFDFAYNTMRGISASIEAARHFLDTEVRAEDELAFVSCSMLKGVRIHEFLTTDHAKVRAALAAIKTKDIAGRADEVEQAYWQLVDLSKSGGGAAKALAEMEKERWDSMHQAQNYFRVLTRFAKALRLVQGQKNVLFFSNGIPSSLVNSSRGVGTDAYIGGGGGGVSVDGGRGTSPQRGSTFEVGNYELRPLQEAMFKEFSASNCSIYSFDTRESSKIPALFDIDQLATRVGSSPLFADNSVYRSDKLTGMDSLKRLSKQTGGKYYSNIILHEKNLEEVSAVTETYYVLGYAIPAAADGKFHNLKVEVTRKGCQVRSQPGYFDPKPFREYTDLEKSIHLFDLALNERSEFQTPKSLPISALMFDAGQGARVRALVRIPKEIWGQFGGKTAELVALFFDAQDELVSLQRTAVPLADYQGKELIFGAGTAARPGVNKCRVVVRDLDTGQSAVASAQVSSGKAGVPGFFVFTPLLVVNGGGSFHLEGVVKGTVESPAWRDIYPYDAAAFTPLIGGEVMGEGQVVVIVPYSTPGVGRADIIFKANLVNSASGETIVLPLELGESTRRGTIETQRMEISLESVPAGKYLLYIHVGDKRSGQVVSGHVPLKIGR
jgi:VWFA-related protein